MELRRSLVYLPMLALIAASDGPMTGEGILECGLRKRFDRPIAQVIDVSIERGGKILRTFRLQMASQPVDGSFRSLVYFLAPPDERGTRVLTIEQKDRSDEHFVFLPFLERTKRIYGGRRRESFLGTDFSYEDMERMRVEELDVEYLGAEPFQGELVDVLSAVPRYGSAYVRSEFRVARSDCNVLEVKRFKVGRATPAKIISISRASMVEIQRELLPTQAIAEDLEANRRTVLRFSEIQLAPEIDQRLFSHGELLKLHGIPGLSRGAEAPQ